MAALNRTATQLYSVSLNPIEKDPNSTDINTEAQAMAAESAPGTGRGGRGGAGGSPAPANVQVKIAWDGLDRRITQLTHMAGSVSYVVPAPDSRTYLFSAQGGNAEGAAAGGGGGPAMYTINEDGTRITRLNTAVESAGGRGGRGGGGFGDFNEPQWARDSRSIYFLQGGGIYSLAISRRPRG